MRSKVRGVNILDILQESRHRDKNNILDAEYECRSRIFDFVLYYEIKHYIRYVLFTPEGKICNRPCLSWYFGLSGNEHSYAKSLQAIFMKHCRIADYCYEKNRLNFGVDSTQNDRTAVISVFHYNTLNITYFIDICQVAPVYCVLSVCTMCNMQAPSGGSQRN